MKSVLFQSAEVLSVTNQELCCIQLLIYCAALSELKLEFPVALIAIG